MDQAKVNHQVAMDAATEAHYIHTNLFILWTLGIGLGMAVLGILALAVAWIWVGAQSKAKVVLTGAGLLIAGILVFSLGLAISDHREVVARVAVIVLIVGLVGAACAAAWAALMWRKVAVETVTGVQAMKPDLTDDQKSKFFGPGGTVPSAMSPPTVKAVAKIKSRNGKEA